MSLNCGLVLLVVSVNDELLVGVIVLLKICELVLIIVSVAEEL